MLIADAGRVGGAARGPRWDCAALSRAARACSLWAMCRNIKPLFNFDPPATDAEVRLAALQFVRKVSGFTKPSQANQAAFDRAVADVSEAARRLVDALVTAAPSRTREEEARRAKERAAQRYGPRRGSGPAADAGGP